MLPSVGGMVTSPCWLGFAAFQQLIELLSASGVQNCDTYSLGPLRVPLSRFDEMNADHLKLLCYVYEVVLLRLQPIPQFYKEVECTALICDHFLLQFVMFTFSQIVL